ncbi:O-antigen ligase family protein [Rossellomorea marisflavi]|uniref:O-antigen ligase family protein n=1 Tax=Rossellomorea marisflavi TaxID=189381 RepID=UPI003D2E29A1
MNIKWNIIRVFEYSLILIYIILLNRDSYYFILSGVNRDIIIFFISFYFIWRLIFIILKKGKKKLWSKQIFLICSLVILSSMWSPDIVGSLKKAILYIFMPYAFSLYIVNKYPTKKILNITFFAGLVISISSYIVTIMFPEVGIMTQAFKSMNLWRGVYTHKNLLSAASCFYLIITLYLYFDSKNKLYLITIFLHIILILLSGSSTGIIVLILSIVFTSIIIIISKIKNYKIRLGITTLFSFTMLLLIVFFVKYINLISEIFGKDLTFSGRTYIWAAVLELIKEHLIFGYGYGGFWINGSFTLNYVNSNTPWNDIHQQSHNGFLDVVSNVGIVGLMLIILTIITYLFRVIKMANHHNLKILSLIFLIFFIIYNLQESFLIEQNFFMWMFYTYFYLNTKKLYNQEVME